MRRALTLLTILLFATSCASSAGRTDDVRDVPRRAQPCGPADARTLAADQSARVYTMGGSVFGCALRAGRSYELGSAGRAFARERVGPVALAGEVAAYGLTSAGVDTIEARVVVRRLTDGARIHRDTATTRSFVEGFQSVTAVVVRRDGAVAWIARAGSIISQHAELTEVQEHGAGGRRLLDSGEGIGPRSLRVRGSTVYWKHGAATRHATLR